MEAKVLKKLRSERVAWRECVARELCGRSRDLVTRGSPGDSLWDTAWSTGNSCEGFDRWCDRPDGPSCDRRRVAV